MDLLGLANTLKIDPLHFHQMSALFRAGRSANYVQQYFSRNIKGYRRSSVQAVKRAVLGYRKGQVQVQQARPDRLISDSQLPTVNHPGKSKYYINLKVDYINPETGESATQYRTFMTDRQATKQEYINWSWDIMSEMEYQETVEPVSVSFNDLALNTGAYE